MALKSDDILLVQRGDQSYQMPASQLGAADSEVAPDLQSVTDKGNTTTNGAEFGNGNITLNADGVCEAVQLRADGGSATAVNFVGKNSDTTTFIVNGDGAAWIGGNIAGSSPNIRLNADGGALFSSTVTTEGDSSYLRVNRTGTLSATAALYQGLNNGNLKFKVASDGSSEFAGPQTLGSASSPATNGYTSLIDNTAASTASCFSGNNFNADGLVFVGVDGGNGNVTTTTIKNDGSATFAGKITTDDRIQINAGGSLDVLGEDDSYDAVRIYNSIGLESLTLKTGGNASFSSGKILLNADGSATFDGNVDIGGDLNTKSATRLYANGAISQRSDLANANQAAWQYYNGGTNDASRKAELKSDGTLLLGGTSPNNQNIKLNADGSAEFAGRVSGTVTTIGNSSSWDMASSNYWTTPGSTLANPTNVTAGQTGVIYCTGEVIAFGNLFSFSGGVTPTIPANSIVPYFVDVDNKIRLGLATEAFV